MSDELSILMKPDNPRKGNNGMTTQPKFQGYKYTDRDGALIDVHPYRTSRGLMVSVTTHAKGNEPGGEIVWIPPEEAPALAQAVLDSAAARAFTDPEPEPLKVRKLGSCYLVDGFHVTCGELNRTADDTRSAIEDAERKLAVLKFQLAEQEKAGQAQEAKAAALQTRLDDLSLWFLGKRYAGLTGGEARAIDRIAELEDGK